MLCVGGGFIAAYYQSLNSTAGTVGGVVTQFAGSTPDYNSAILAKVAVYLQQTVPSNWATYSLLGVVIVIGGTILVAMGDRKQPMPGS